MFAKRCYFHSVTFNVWLCSVLLHLKQSIGCTLCERQADYFYSFKDYLCTLMQHKRAQL